MLKSIIKWSVIAVMLCSASVMAASTPAEQVKDAIDKALAHPYMAHGFQGVLVQSMDTGKVVYNHNGDIMLIPASNMKLIDTSAALDLIGPDYKMTTSLYVTSKPSSEGLLKGDVVLVGQGDSTFSMNDLQEMADKLKKAGIRNVDGNIVGDDSWFEDPATCPAVSWDDIHPCALNVNENDLEVHAKPGKKAGAPAIIETIPGNAYFTIKNECVTGAAGSECTAKMDRQFGKDIITVSGSVPIGDKDAYCGYYCVDKPNLFVCSLFKELLQKDGIKVSGQPLRGIKPNNAVLIASHYSPNLAEIIHRLNKPSNNFMAECLLRTLGKEVAGNGSYEAGKKVEYDWLAKIGADPKQVYISDASGLSRSNLISPYDLVVILTYMYKTKYYDILSNSLPIAGVDSHLQFRMLNTPAVNNVKAKTGYIQRVCSLSGYVKTLAGENMAVSVIQNNHLCTLKEANDIQDMIFVAVSEITARTDVADK